MYVRERDSGMYDIWVYATTKLIAEIPIMLIVPLIFNLMVYFAIGFTDTVKQFTAYYLVLMMIIQAATAMGYTLSSFFNHETTAVAFAPIVNMPLNLLGGYMISLKNIFQQSPQRYVAWLMYFSPVRYSFTAMMVAQFPIHDDDNPKVYENTQKILVDYGLENKSYWGCLGMLFLMFIFFRTTVVLSLILQDRQERKSGGGDTRNTNIPARNPARASLKVIEEED